MKKQLRKKLTLSRETVRNLSERHVGAVVGAATGLPCTGQSGPGTEASECFHATCGPTCASECPSICMTACDC